MAIGDILKSIGEDVAQGAKRAGSAFAPIAERTAQVVSGEAPQIDEEERKQKIAMEDAALNAKANDLEAQLEMGRKYGTLTPQQQQQYIDQITGLYSHPRHMSTLLTRLQKAIHPGGATYQPSTALPNATPPGGTGAADEANAEKLAATREQVMLAEIDRRAQDAAKYHKPAGKSPAIPGNQIPPDAIGADGQPIPAAARDAQHSFVEWNGSWWPVAKPKPVFKTVKGHSVLVDGQTGNILRDLGPVGTARITSRQELQPGDDGQMHLVTLTSVSTPEGGKIDVQPEEGGEQPTVSPASPPKPATSAKKVSPGSILPKTGAKPANPQGPVVQGLSSLANKKLETPQDRQVLESSKQIISAVDDLLPILEKRKSESGLMDEAKLQAEFQAYKMGIPPKDPDQTKIFENAALLGVVGASIWSRIGRSRYTFEVIQQHLPKPTDTPQLMYDKVKWLKDHVVPAAQEAIKNPQPDSAPVEIWTRDANGKLVRSNAP